MTSWPWRVSSATRPPAPDSGSSGCPPKTTTRSLLAGSSPARDGFVRAEMMAKAARNRRVMASSFRRSHRFRPGTCKERPQPQSHLPLEAGIGDDALESLASLIGTEGGIEIAVPTADLDQSIRSLVVDRLLAEQVQGRQGRARVLLPDGPEGRISPKPVEALLDRT